MTSQAHALSLHYLNDLISESTAQVDIVKDLFLGLFDVSPPNQSIIAAFFVEALWSNYRILQLIDLHLKGVPKNEKKVYLPVETLQVLQSLLLNRDVAVVELSRLSYSISVH